MERQKEKAIQRKILEEHELAQKEAAEEEKRRFNLEQMRIKKERERIEKEAAHKAFIEKKNKLSVSLGDK